MAMRPIDQHYGPSEEEGLGAVWGFLGTLFVFKMATVVLIFVHMRSWESGLLLTATTWFWFPIVGVLVAGPLLFRYRLLRVRAKRERLRQAEWMVTEKSEVSR